MKRATDITPVQPPRRRPEVRALRTKKVIDTINRPYAGIASRRLPRRRLRASSLPPATSRTTTGLKIERPHSRLKRIVTTGLFMAIAVLGLAVLADQPIGLVAVIGYGFLAFIHRIPSRVTLAASLVIIMLVLFSFYLFGGRNVVTSALSTYAFLLLAIGIITEWRDSFSATSEG